MTEENLIKRESKGEEKKTNQRGRRKGQTVSNKKIQKNFAGRGWMLVTPIQRGS